jgi:hypothetical protein
MPCQRKVEAGKPVAVQPEPKPEGDYREKAWWKQEEESTVAAAAVDRSQKRRSVAE